MRFLLILLLLSIRSEGQETRIAPDRAVVFSQVNVVPMDKNEVLRDYTVVVKNGKISEMGRSGSINTPSGALVVNARGKYLVPGWSEMHAHVPQTDDLEPMKEVLMLYLLNGVTNIRGMLGAPKHLELRDKIKSGEILGPHFITSGPSFSGQSVRNPERGVEMVRDQKAAGYDFLKLHPGLTKATFPGIASTARQVGIPIAGHVSFNVGVWAAIDADYATIDHLDGFVEALTPGLDTMAANETGLFGARIAYRADRSGIPKLITELRKNNIAVVPTEALASRWLGPDGVEKYEKDPDLKYMDPKERERWLQVKRNYNNEPVFNRRHAEAFIDLRHQLIRECQKGGVLLLLGSDAPQILNVPGFATHHELQLMVDAGLTPYEALQTGTVNVAKFLKKNDSGAIRKGYVSDLVLLSDNPLENIANTRKIEAVMIGNHYLPKEYITRELKRLEK